MVGRGDRLRGVKQANSTQKGTCLSRSPTMASTCSANYSTTVQPHAQTQKNDKKKISTALSQQIDFEQIKLTTNAFTLVFQFVDKFLNKVSHLDDM